MQTGDDSATDQTIPQSSDVSESRAGPLSVSLTESDNILPTDVNNDISTHLKFIFLD